MAIVVKPSPAMPINTVPSRWECGLMSTGRVCSAYNHTPRADSNTQPKLGNRAVPKMFSRGSKAPSAMAATPTKRKLTATTINPRQPPEHPTARRPNVRRNQRHSLSVIVAVVRGGQQFDDVRHGPAALRLGSLAEIVPPSDPHVRAYMVDIDLAIRRYVVQPKARWQA